jgi:hypothetical protein
MVRRLNPAPVPLHIIFDDTRSLSLNSAATGALIRLVWHYWLTDCAPLPRSDHALYQIARAHKPTWYQHREAIKAILADALPALERAKERRENMVESMNRLRAKSHSLRSLATAARKANVATDPAPVVQPKRKQANRAPAIKPSIDSGWQD